MKPKSMKTILLAALMAPGALFAQTTATTTPVGYETVGLPAGFNYIGLRLHESIVVSGTLSAVAAGSVTDAEIDLGAVLDDATTYILEVSNASGGATVEFIGSSATASVINLTSDLTSVAAANNNYSIRKSATLASVFGANNSAGLDTGFFGPGGDLVFLPNSTGGFDQFYYDAGQSSWADATGNPVSANTPIIYVDGVIISSTGAGAANLVVAGEVKKAPTRQLLAAGSFNYLSSVYPVGSTLASAFNGSLANIDKGFFGPGGDLFFVPNGAGGFNQFYYDDGQGSWADSTGATVDATTIVLAPGIIISNDGPAVELVNASPALYSSL